MKGCAFYDKKMKKIIIISLLIQTLLSGAQTTYSSSNNLLELPKIVIDTTVFSNFDNVFNKKIYKLDIGDFPESIQFIENKEGAVEGRIITIFYSRNTKKEVFVKTPIGCLLSKKLMKKIKRKGIEKINNCTKNDYMNTLDGTYTCFYILDDSSKKSLGFWSLGVNEKITFKTPKDRKQALKIIKLLDKYLNLKNILIKSKSILPKGKYLYSTDPMYISHFEIK